MLESIRSFFQHRMAPDPEGDEPTAGQPPIRIAACALLLELAYADSEFAESERRHLHGVLQRHFDVDDDTAGELVRLAEEERAKAVDLFGFTSLIAQQYSDAQKMVLLEAMWGLVFADGEVAKHEASLMRRVSKLLDVRPGFLAEARRKAAPDEA